MLLFYMVVSVVVIWSFYNEFTNKYLITFNEQIKRNQPYDQKKKEKKMGLNL